MSLVSPSEKFVKQYYPDARCVKVDYTYRGKTTWWYVIYFNYGTSIDNLGASRKNEMVAWRNAVYWTKQRIHKIFLEKLES
jgi:hypothetical protein